MSHLIAPSKFWPTILEAISSGKSLSSALNQKGFPSYSWAKLSLRQDPELRRAYEQAVEDRAHRLAEELLELADQKMPVGLAGPEALAWVQHQRLRVDVRKWTASKLLPKIYGDKLDVSVAHQKISVIDALEQARNRVLPLAG